MREATGHQTARSGRLTLYHQGIKRVGKEPTHGAPGQHGTDHSIMTALKPAS